MKGKYKHSVLWKTLLVISRAAGRYERMPYKYCGKSGLQLPLISLGLWHNFGSVDNFDKLIPADGVYAVWVTFDKKTYMGMLNIGVRPTIDNGPNRTIEVNILHFHSDIYDKFIRLTFVKRTRPELKFSSIDELIVQLHKDAEETEAILLASKAGSNSRETK